MDIGTYLREIHAEPAFRKWCEQQGTLEISWQKCERADWMLHLLENSGQPDGHALRLFCRNLLNRFTDHLPTTCQFAVTRAVSDAWDVLDSSGRPSDQAIWESARATVEAAEIMNRIVGNWTAARVLAIFAASLLNDPVLAAKGSSEQAGIAAQYIHPFPTVLDWSDEMACQASCLRSVFNHPFEHVRFPNT